MFAFSFCKMWNADLERNISDFNILSCEAAPHFFKSITTKLNAIVSIAKKTYFNACTLCI